METIQRVFTEVEKVIDYLGPKGFLRHDKMNFDGDARVMLEMHCEGKPVRQILLSPGLSKKYRAKEIKTGNIMSLMYSVDDRGVFFVRGPRGPQFDISVENCTVEDLVVDMSSINPMELVAF